MSFALGSRPPSASEAYEALVATIGSDPARKLDELRQAGERKAKAVARAYQMEELRKVVLGRVAGQIAQEHSGKGLSEAKLERLARAHGDYERHLKGTAAAIEEKESAVADYYRIKAEIELGTQVSMFAMSMAKLER